MPFSVIAICCLGFVVDLDFLIAHVCLSVYLSFCRHTTTVIQTADAERRCTAPATMQPAIDALVAAVTAQPARAFVRPSGTEDVVRVYAEAGTQQACDALARDVAAAVHRLAGGVGELKF